MSPYKLVKRFALSLLVLSLSCLAANADIKIGVALPLTGIYASLSKQIISGVEFAAEEINEEGGIKGEKIIIEKSDDKCEPKNGPEIAKQLIEKKVIAVIGHLCDRPSIAASPIYSENKIVQLSPTNQNAAFTENRPLESGGTYRLAARTSQQIDVLTSFLVTHEQKAKIALLNNGSAYGKGLSDALTKTLKEKGITPLLATSFESGAERYSNLARRIVESGARLVFIGSTHLDAARLIRDIDNLSGDITIIGGDGLVHVEFPKLVLENNPKRNTLSKIFTSFPVDPRSLESAANAVNRFKKSDINPAGLVLRGYSAMKILGKAMSSAEKLDFENLNKALNKQDFQTPLGTIRFDEKGDANLSDYVVHQWRDNHIVALK